MKNSSGAGAISGCVVWLLVFGIAGSCLFPAAMFAGGFSSSSSLAIRTTGGILCPENTMPESYSYETTTTDEYGNTQPATAYELHCVDSGGQVVKSDPVGYAFLWMGMAVLVALILTVALAFLLAAPAGVIVARILKRRSNSNAGISQQT